MFEIKKGADNEIPVNINGDRAKNVNMIEAVFKLGSDSDSKVVLKKECSAEKGNMSIVNENCVSGIVEITADESAILPVGIIYMDTVIHAINESSKKTEILNSGAVQKGRVIRGFAGDKK